MFTSFTHCYRVTSLFRMDIRKWLNKGTSQKFKDDLKASKKGRKALDSSDEETEKENPKLKTPKPVPEKVKTAVSPKDFFKKKNKTPEKPTKKRKASDDVEFVASTLTPVKKSKVETTKRKSPEVKSTAQSSQDNLPKPELPMPVIKEKSLPNVKALEIKKSASEDAMDTDSAPKTPAEVRKANYLKFKAKARVGTRPDQRDRPVGVGRVLTSPTRPDFRSEDQNWSGCRWSVGGRVFGRSVVGFTYANYKN